MNNAEFPAGLAGNGTVFLRPPHEIWNNIFYRAKRKILAYGKIAVGQVKGYIIAHTVQLREMHMRMVVWEFFFIQQLRGKHITVFIMGSYY